jgi:hypothetical protein
MEIFIKKKQNYNTLWISDLFGNIYSIQPGEKEIPLSVLFEVSLVHKPAKPER